MNKCKQIQDRLAESGPIALREDIQAQEHLVECEACYKLLETLDRVEQGLASLPPLDAPDEVVARLLERDELFEPVTPTLLAGKPGRWMRWLVWGGGGLVSASLLLALFVFRTETVIVELARPIPEIRLSDSESRRLDQDALSPEEQSLKGSISEPPPPPTSDQVGERLTATIGSGKAGEYDVQDADGDGNVNVRGSRSRDFKAIVGGAANVDPNSIEEMDVITAGAGEEFAQTTEDISTTAEKQKRNLAKNEPVGNDQGSGGETSNLIQDNRSVSQHRASGRPQSIAVDDSLAVAVSFIDERNTTEGVEFREATGYWSNSYLPGDRLMRLLHARLATGPAGFDVRRLHAAVRPTIQPLDAPRHAALSVQLQSDRRATEGPARTLVQVGIKGIEHQGGRRSAMNLAIVVHVDDDTPVEVATGVRAIADALNAARRPGDRFRLIIAGEPGGVAVDADRFRHGELLVALSRLFDAEDDLDGPEWDLAEALNKAIGRVAMDDDPSATLGTSAVLIVTGRELESDEDHLNALAHRSAVAGIPVGVIAVGADADPRQLERLTVSGQGRFGVLLRPADAESLIDRELAAVSRAVARAVRLRIRLAPGVELVNVIGSVRLDERAADRVRQSEQSLDLRLARNLGITADRGEDEDGIQIVIPNFYAADEHVILLDVVTPGAGPLIDVTARFKDLVHLKNGTVRARLSLDRGIQARGPAEFNVLKNYLAHELSETLQVAGNALRQNDRDTADSLLSQHESLLAGLTSFLPGLLNDRDIAADIVLLANYREALGRPDLTDEQRNWLADSLRYAAGARLHTPEAMERNPS